jgi:hypothetical protein
MDAADVLYGVSMGGDGVTKVISRKLPREERLDDAEPDGPDAPEAPPPFAGVPAEDEPLPEEGLGVAAATPPAGEPGKGSTRAA